MKCLGGLRGTLCLIIRPHHPYLLEQPAKKIQGELANAKGFSETTQALGNAHHRDQTIVNLRNRTILQQ